MKSSRTLTGWDSTWEKRKWCAYHKSRCKNKLSELIIRNLVDISSTNTWIDHLHTKNYLDINLEKNERQAQIDIIEIITITKQMNTPDRDLQIKLKLFSTILYSKILYNCETWTNLWKTDLENLDKIVLDNEKDTKFAHKHTWHGYICRKLEYSQPKTK